MKKILLRLAVFVLVSGMILSGAAHVLRPKHLEDNTFATFYELPVNSVDVMALGTSHIFTNFNPAILWDQHGISSYALATPNQPLWLSYYNLKEVMKTQRPKLIILEGYSLLPSMLSTEESVARVKVNSFGMALSKNRMEGILASVPPEYLLETVIAPISYHGRYQDLSKKDFLPYRGNEAAVKNQKGYEILLSVSAVTPPSPSAVFASTPLPLPDQIEEYYRKILELCQTYDIPVFVVVAPYANISEEQSRMFLSAEKIAMTYGADFLNTNLISNQLTIDYTADFINEGHLNYWGSAKFSQYIAEYLDENYSLPDHRGDPTYATWEQNALYINRTVENHELCNTSNLDDYLHLLSAQSDFVIVASLSGDYQRGQAIDLPSLLSAHKMNIPIHGAAIFQNGQSVHQIHQGDERFHMELGSHDLEIKSDFTYQTARMTVDRLEKQKVADGLNFLVYDPYTDSIVDSVGFDALNDYAAVRE